LVFRQAIDFFKLILYPAMLLSLFMLSRNFWVEFFGYLRYRIILSGNKNNLTVSLPICIPLISSSCLIAMARNSSTMLNRSWGDCSPLSHS
jgi:hypothetical protein